MSQYNIFQAIAMSFYSGKLYRDVGQNWGGKVFGYLFILLSFTWIVPTIQAQASLNVIYAKLSDSFVAEIPVITITNGKISTPENKPYILKDTTEPNKKDNIFAIIDTTGQYTSLDNTSAFMLVTDSKVISKHNDHEIRTYDIPANYNAVYNPATINESIKHYISYAWIVIYFTLLLVSYFYRIVQALLYSVIGKIFSSLSGYGVNFGTILNVTMVALTPPILLSTFCQLADFNFPHQPLTYFIISMCYMIYGIRANKT